MNNLNRVAELREAILQGLNNLADLGIFTTDAQLNISSWNHWLEIHSRRSATEMLGRSLLEAYPEMAERRLQRFYQQALNGQVVVLSQRLHGYLIPMRIAAVSCSQAQMLQSVRIAPLVAGGQNIGTITFIEDVTERVEREAELQRQIEALQRAEVALLSTQHRLQHLLSSSPAVIYTCKPYGDWDATFISDNITAQLGYHPWEFMEDSRFWIDRIHPEDAPQVLADMAQLRSRGHHILEYRFLHKDGSYRWVRDEMKLVRKSDSNLLEIVGAWHDITDRKQAEEQVMEQAALLNIATDAILVRDLDSRILFWNKGAERLYGWTAEEATGQLSKVLLHKETSPHVADALKTVTEAGSWQGELHQVTKNGAEIIVESRWTLVRTRRGKPKSVLVVNTDITQKKQLEAQFLRIQRIESIGTLAGGIAHDLNNILTPILASAQLLQMELPPEKKQGLLVMVENNAKRGANLIKQVLSFARGMEGEHTILEVSHVIREIAEVARETFPKSIEVRADIAADLWAVSGDATQLHQVLMNLCVNARDAMPSGGKLSICAANLWIDPHYAQMNIEAREGPYTVIAVSDTGTGIRPEIQERIFEPFFTTKELGKGTGLGLSTVVGIVRSHGGFIKLDSQSGRGTQFQVYLPAVGSTETPELEEVEIPQGQKELVLVVDDEPDLRDITEIALQKYAYRVLTASDGIEAVALYAEYKNEISVVLLNMMMPHMDGPTAIRTLQKIKPSVKIIAVSGLLSTEMIAEATRLGVTAFLSKPYTAKELLKTLHKAAQ
ncbi:hybrid sensor histidine kinase/response regulator [Kamptonema formosum]|uniref:hybrid sensor histidine kinase/response regulator n=1 Tax=Kamptonema formosum TaxID=331992 RepID=UPI00036B96EC|nr:PAS domain S-box protein [Oscillatoria sp. PCC 10802]